ncbi:SRPBCC domain-containing protein [uncultured Shimia sp.]|uniref:SRPBCC family protein n=1 Tax=uncultured Shimia sp. TaxID=573152 RepID=UPI00260F4E36|nr:SRPBCC domain-containing protein [uncultured Shimia sp.]
MDFEKSYVVPAKPADVYAAWVSSDTVIAPAKRMFVEPVIGGAYQLFMTGTSAEPDCEGRFAEVRPRELLRCSWQWSGDPEKTEITVTFHDDGSGTKLTVRHLGFETQESFQNHAAGWDSYVAGLTDLLHQNP